MKTVNHSFSVAAIASILLSLICSLSYGQNDQRFGYVTVDLLGGSDTLISVPFNNQAAAVGVLDAAPTQGSGLASLTIKGNNPSWSTDQYQDLFYVRFLDGALEGLYFTVDGNDSDTLHVQDRNIDFSGVAADTRFELVPYWTLETLFPSNGSNGLTPSTGNFLFQRGSEIHYRSQVVPGVNYATDLVFYYTSAEGWKKSDAGFPSAGNYILSPNTYFIIRQPNVASDTTISFAGSVNMDTTTIVLKTLNSGKQDNHISLDRPIPITLSNSGLSSGFTPSSGNFLFQRQDELLVYDNSLRSKNKAPYKVFFLNSSNDWIESNSGFPVSNSWVIEPGSALVVRKSTSDGADDYLADAPTF